MPTSFVVPPLESRRNGTKLVLVLVLIAALTVFFIREVADLRRTMEALRTNDVTRIEIRNVLMHLLDAETGQRGYLITGDEGYLLPYMAGKNKVRDSLRRAEESGFTDTAFLAEIRELTLLTEARLEELERTVLLRKRGDSAGAVGIVMQGHGRSSMLESRRIIQARLDRLRSTRDSVMDEFSERLLRAAAILVTMLSAVAALAANTWRSLNESARENNDLAQRLAQEASHDALTNLPNRRFFDRWARRLLHRNERARKCFTLLLIDLDGFKKVNDAFGHAMGDEVLREAAARLQQALRGGEFLARLGGDEFGLLIDIEVSRAEAARIGKRLIESLAPPLHPRLARGAVGASIGVATFPVNGTDLESLMEAADTALYRSKDQGRGGVSFSSRIVLRRLTDSPPPQERDGPVLALFRS